MDTIFFTRLQYLCSQSAVKDVSGVLRALGLSTSKGTAWKSGAIPKGDILLKLANFFHVSTDYLLGNTDDPTPPEQKESPPHGGEQQPRYYMLNQENRAVIDDLIEKLLKSQSSE